MAPCPWIPRPVAPPSPGRGKSVIRVLSSMSLGLPRRHLSWEQEPLLFRTCRPTGGNASGVSRHEELHVEQLKSWLENVARTPRRRCHQGISLGSLGSGHQNSLAARARCRVRKCCFQRYWAVRQIGWDLLGTGISAQNTLGLQGERCIYENADHPRGEHAATGSASEK